MTTFIGFLDPNNPLPPSFTKTVRLRDPSGEEERLYLLTDGGMIYELTRVQGDDNDGEEYTSQFVGKSLVVNQPLYTLNPVDPLFWMLYAHGQTELSQQRSSTTKTSTQWQPMDQILAATASTCVPIQVLQPYLDRTQLRHLYQCMNMGSGGDDDHDNDECFFKFCEKRALKWLTRKQEEVQTVLLAQAAAEPGSVISGKGAFATGFNPSADFLAQQQQENCGQQQTNSNKMTQRAKDESIQIVCQYLDENWRERFLTDLQVPRTSLLGSPKVVTTTAIQLPTVAAPSLEAQLLATGTLSVNKNNNSNKPPPKKQKLKPSDARGTKKLTSFFTKK